jgi:hypothetical protein
MTKIYRAFLFFVLNTFYLAQAANEASQGGEYNFLPPAPESMGLNDSDVLKKGLSFYNTGMKWAIYSGFCVFFFIAAVNFKNHEWGRGITAFLAAFLIMMIPILLRVFGF